MAGIKLDSSCDAEPTGVVGVVSSVQIEAILFVESNSSKLEFMLWSLPLN